MTPADLLAKCDEQIAHAGPGTVVVLVLKGRRARGARVRLVARRGPLGDVYADDGGGLTVGFPAVEVRDFLAAELGGQDTEGPN